MLGFVLVLVASCALTTLHWQPGVLRHSAGGVVGKLVGGGLAAGVDFLGATLLMIAAWMAGISAAGVAAFPLVSVPVSPSAFSAAIAPPEFALSAVVKYAWPSCLGMT